MAKVINFEDIPKEELETVSFEEAMADEDTIDLDDAIGALREFLGGTTLNLSNYLEAWLTAEHNLDPKLIASQTDQEVFNPYSEVGSGEGFRKKIEEIRQIREAFAKENPKAAFALDMSGTVLGGILTGSLVGSVTKGAAKKILGSAAKDATKKAVLNPSIMKGAAKLAKLVGLGSASEAIREYSRTGKTEHLDRAALLGGVGAGLGLGVGKVAEKAFGTPLEKAFRSLGGGKVALKKAEGKIDEIGNDLLEQGIVHPAATKKSMLSKVNERISTYSKRINDMLERIDKKVADNPSDYFTKMFRASDDDLMDEFVDEFDDLVISRGMPKDDAKSALRAIKKYLSGGREHTLEQLHTLKKKVGKDLADRTWETPELGPAEEGLKKLYLKLKNKIEESVEYFGEVNGQPGIGHGVRETNRKMGSMLEAKNILTKSIPEETEKAFLSGGDLFATSVGATAGGAVGGPAGVGTGIVGTLGVKKFIEKKGLQTGAYLGEKLGEAGLAGLKNTTRVGGAHHLADLADPNTREAHKEMLKSGAENLLDIGGGVMDIIAPEAQSAEPIDSEIQAINNILPRVQPKKLPNHVEILPLPRDIFGVYMEKDRWYEAMNNVSPELGKMFVEAANNGDPYTMMQAVSIAMKNDTVRSLAEPTKLYGEWGAYNSAVHDTDGWILDNNDIGRFKDELKETHSVMDQAKINDSYNRYGKLKTGVSKPKETKINMAPLLIESEKRYKNNTIS